MYAFCLNISEIYTMYSFARMCTINRLSRCYWIQSKLQIWRSYQILLLPNSCTKWLEPYIINVDITEIEVIDTSNVFECITHRTSLTLLLRIGDHWKLSVRLFRAEPLRHQPEAGYRRIILCWLVNIVVLCQNDVICAFYSPKTMELILVVFISCGITGMVENSQNGVAWLKIAKMVSVDLSHNENAVLLLYF